MNKSNHAYHNPDAYLAQDAENRFRFLFFMGDNYQMPAVVVPQVSYVEDIRKHGQADGPVYGFRVLFVGGENSVFRYRDKANAVSQRNALLMAVEHCYSNRIHW